eukprot:2585074-Pyramimonas_sp.AAC.1
MSNITFAFLSIVEYTSVAPDASHVAALRCRAFSPGASAMPGGCGRGRHRMEMLHHQGHRQTTQRGRPGHLP